MLSGRSRRSQDPEEGRLGIGRHLNRRIGAEARVGSVDNEKFLTETFSGTDAGYAMIPPNFHVENFRKYQNRIGEAYRSAVQKAGVEHVLFLSSLGAHVPDKTGPIAGLHDVEGRIAANIFGTHEDQTYTNARLEDFTLTAEGSHAVYARIVNGDFVL